ncbi:ephrin-B1-like isoform X2 [Macrobrachium nipponense]|uniref:ephrin-B1-like isoform X2 n=1 Tax=Macrobrachium nipponense TaxID=159736 RepID=UPI0030C824CD
MDLIVSSRWAIAADSKCEAKQSGAHLRSSLSRRKLFFFFIRQTLRKESVLLACRVVVNVLSLIYYYVLYVKLFCALPFGGVSTNKEFTMSVRSCSYWTIVVVVCVEVLCLCRLATSTKMHYIHWNTSNPIFRIDNTDHIIDVNKGNIPFEYDQVNIICPVYNEEETSEDEAEKYIIYNVSKEEYDTCRITNVNPRVIAVCDKPYKLMYFTITFRSFTPQPGGLEFRPGQDYYFISTSSKDDLHRRIGGRCSSHHMKVVFKVCCDPASQPAHDQANNHIPNNDTNQPDRSENEVVKNQLTLNSSPPLSSSPVFTAFLTTFLSMVATWLLNKHS